MIRTATATDLPAIARLHVLSWQTAYSGVVPHKILASRTVDGSLSGWRSTLKSYPDNLAVALDGDRELIGFCCSGPVVDTKRSGPFDFEIYGLHLNPLFHRQGIGTALIAHSFNRMRNLGLCRAIVWTFEGHINSRRFYEKHGGTVVNNAVWEVGGHKISEVAYGWTVSSLKHEAA